MFCFALLKVAALKNVTDIGEELAKLAEQLVDIVRILQSQTELPESGPDNKLNISGTVGSDGRGKVVGGWGGGWAGLGTASNWSNMNMFAVEGLTKSQSFTTLFTAQQDGWKFGMLEVR